MNTINIAGIDELGILKNRLSNKQKVKSMTTCGFVSCKANMENLLYDNDVLDCINTSFPPVSTFVSKLNGADVLFFDVNPKKASIIIDYNFSTMVLPDAKLVVFRFDSKENLVKVALQDLVKCFPNAVIAGFIFKTNGIKGFTNFLNTPNFYKLLNGESPKGDSQQDLEKAKKNRIKKLLSSGEFKSLCKGDVSSNYFYSSAVNENFYFSINSSEIDNYSSLSKAIQREITKNSDSSKLANIKNSAIFTGTVMFDAFESFVDDDDLQYNVANVKNAHRFIYDQFKKKDVDQTFPGYFLPIQSLTGVRPGDLMLSVDFDDKSENFRIVSSVGNDGKVDVVGLNNGQIVSKSLNIKNLSKGTSSSEYVKELSYEVRCYEEKKMSVCGVSNGATYTSVYLAGKKISDANVEQLGIEAVRDSSGMLFYFARPLLLNHLFDEWEDAPSKPVSMDENKTVSPKQEKDLNKFFKECEKTIKNYKIIDYISNTALANYNEDMSNLGIFESIGYVHTDISYWNEIQKRIYNYNIKSIFTQEEKDAMYQMHKADSSFSVMNEVHKKIFGVDYDEKKVKEANRAFFLYLTIYRFNLIRENIDKQVKRILSDAIFSKAVTNYSNSKVEKIDAESYRKQIKQYDAIDKEKHDELFNLFCHIFGVTNKDDYKSLTTDQLYQVITEFTEAFDFLSDLLPNIENYASYQSIEAFGYDFAIIIKCEKKLFENARHNGDAFKNALLFITGCYTARISSVFISAGVDAAISVGLDTLDLILRANFSNSEIDYQSEIVKILVNAILSFGTSAVVGGVMNKCTKKIADIIAKNKAAYKLFNEELKALEKKSVDKQNIESFISKLDEFGENLDKEINDSLRLTEKKLFENSKKIKELENDFKFNEELKQKIEYIYNKDFMYINAKEIKFLSDGKTYNVIDFINDKRIINELESDIRKTLNETEFKNFTTLGPKEKTVYLIEKKIADLKDQIRIYRTKSRDVSDFYFSYKNQLESEYENGVHDLEIMMRDFLGEPNFKLGKFSDFSSLLNKIQDIYNTSASNLEKISEIKNLISKIESMEKSPNDKTISLLRELNEEKEKINEILKDNKVLLNGLDSLFSTSICYALSSQTSSLFDNSDENWLDRSVEDVISENIHKIFMASIDEESIEKQKKEYERYKINTAQQQNMISALEDNPFTVYIRPETDALIVFKGDDCVKIGLPEYSEEVKNWAKKILTKQNVPYDLNYTEFKHLKIACFTRLVNKLIVEDNLNVGLQQLVKKENEMREKYPEMNKLLNGVKR